MQGFVYQTVAPDRLRLVEYDQRRLVLARTTTKLPTRQLFYCTSSKVKHPVFMFHPIIFIHPLNRTPISPIRFICLGICIMIFRNLHVSLTLMYRFHISITRPHHHILTAKWSQNDPVNILAYLFT